MTAWTALFKKDFRLTRTAFIVGLVFDFLIFLLTMLVDRNTGNNLFLFIPLIVAVVLHVIYLPILLFISLRKEAERLHLWMHNPRSAAALLLSKVLNGLIMAVVSLVVLYSMAGMLIRSRFGLIEAYWADTRKAALLIFPHIILVSIMLGVWVILLWSLYHALKYKMGRWTTATLLAAVILLYWIASLFDSSNLYKQLIQWGSMEARFPTFKIDPIPTYAGEYLFHFVVMIGLFCWSAWILDRKVEV
ncbi:hypothetical protein D7Z26_01465 [Cohnella endophytica]|uniref:ABC transporter permease n=1 Tax=Cohnella endophytica TaxID=2419778 RepID=A0A494Y6A3_9BACL|nr:hypothetical protein [Cohnella endophytica]RKP58197.1 hypothetical protein D7Z26_01465 [Cohnella endophytica]